MIISGIDPSMSSTGIVKFYLDENLNIVNTDYMGFCQVKKNADDVNVFHYNKKDYRNRYDITLWMSDKIFNFIKDSDYISMEDYAYGANGVVFDIGEFVGYIKMGIYKRGIPLRLYDPLSNKKFATKHGDSDKISMYNSFCNLKEQKPNLDHLPEPNKSSGVSPTSDIVDAYFLCDLLRTELQLRKGIITLKDLPEHKIEIFNRVTKNRPVNILSTDFLEPMKNSIEN